MWIIKFAWKNLWRNRSRTLITASAIFFAVILSTTAEGLKKGIFDNLVKNVVGFYTGYIQVHKLGYQEEPILDNSFSPSDQLESTLRSEKNIKSFTTRLESFTLASSRNLTKGCMVSGISPKMENSTTGLKMHLVEGLYLDENDSAVLLAQGLAKKLDLQINDTLVLIGQGFHGAMAAGKYRVKGLLKFGSPQLNDRILYMSLPAAEGFFNTGNMITSYIMTVYKENKLNNTARVLREKLGKDYELLTWEDLLPDVRQHIASDSNNMKIVQGVLYLLICFGIFSTLLMLMIERKFEMGMLIAIGMQKSKLVLLLILESLLTVILGCLAGMITSIPLLYYLNRNPIRLGGETARAYERFGFEPIFPASTDSTIFLYQGMIVLVIGFFLSLYPVISVIRLHPIEAMRK